MAGSAHAWSTRGALGRNVLCSMRTHTSRSSLAQQRQSLPPDRKASATNRAMAAVEAQCKRKPSAGSVFADYFSTDGVSVSLLYKKPASVPTSAVIKRYKKHKGFVIVEGQDMRSASPPQLPGDGQRLIALDPGRRDVVFGSVLGSDETVHMSTGQLCHDSGRRWSKRQSDKIFSAVKHAGSTLATVKANLPSSKTSSWMAWEIFVAEYAPLLQPTLDVWKRRCFRKTAFWCYGKKDKCLDSLCKRITGGVRGTQASSNETGEDPRSESVHRRRMLHQPEVLSMYAVPEEVLHRRRRHMGAEALRPL
jgi:hypothetical protein